MTPKGESAEPVSSWVLCWLWRGACGVGGGSLPVPVSAPPSRSGPVTSPACAVWVARLPLLLTSDSVSVVPFRLLLEISGSCFTYVIQSV